MKRLPFLVQPKQEIVAIGSPEYGIIHLLKKGGISPNENPVDLQEAGTRQAKVQLMLQQAINRLAKEEGISKKEARQKLFKAPVKTAATEAEGAAVEVDDETSLYDHLSPEETLDLLNLREDTAKIAIVAATLFIRHRVAYPVQTVSSVRAKASNLAVAPLTFPISEGAKIAFKTCKVEVDGAQDYEAETIATKPIREALTDHEIGYLCNESGKYLIGAEDWTEDDTRNTMTEQLIADIYEFYQAEMAGLTDEMLKDRQEAEVETEGKNRLLESSAA